MSLGPFFFQALLMFVTLSKRSQFHTISVDTQFAYANMRAEYVSRQLQSPCSSLVHFYFLPPSTKFGSYAFFSTLILNHLCLLELCVVSRVSPLYSLAQVHTRFLVMHFLVEFFRLGAKQSRQCVTAIENRTLNNIKSVKMIYLLPCGVLFY